MTEIMRRSGAVSPGTFNEATMTIEAVLSSFADVRRNGFVERLDPAGLDTSRLVGAPLLNAHRAGDGRDVIGTVTAVRIENGDLVGTIRLSLATDVAPLVQRIREGSLRGVSLGYRVSRWVDSIDPSSGQRVRTAAAWQPFEASAVPVAADPRATFRSHEMTTENEQTGIETPMPPENADAPRIRALAEVAGLTTEWADDIVRRGLDLEDARLSAQAELMRRSQSAPRIRAHVGVSGDDPSVILRRQEDALFSRMMGTEPPAEAREFMGLTLAGHAANALRLRGEKVGFGESAETVLRRAAMHTASDFPMLTSAAGNRSLVASYEAARSPIVAQIARRAPHKDFKGRDLLRIGEIAPLARVNEAGEIKSVSRIETGESYAIDSFAGMFALSFKAKVNDDLGAFGDWTRAAGQSAANTEAALVWSLLSQANGAGPTMKETGKRLFSTDHKNLMPGSGLSVTALGDARLLLRTMKGVDRKTPIQVRPRFLVVGPTLETWGEQVLSEIAAAKVDDANPFSGSFVLCVEPRIEDDQWFVFADPSSLPVLEIGHLGSAPGPQMSSREGWETLSTEYRVVMHTGAGIVDWRGAVRNPGV